MAGVALLRADGHQESAVAVQAQLDACGLELVPFSDSRRPDAVIITLQEPDDHLWRVIDNALDRAPTIVLSGVALEPHWTWRLLDMGVADVIEASDAGAAAAMVKSRVERIERVTRLLERPEVAGAFIGTSPAWLRVIRELAEVAYFSTAGVLITGESGTGKEAAARLIHALDQRPNKGPFVVLDCGTVSADLAGSELFGHVHGAYTGAIAEREGALSLANGGTLFLDELGELPLGVQAQLLRAIEEKAFKPVGAIRWKRSDFRLVCATNRNLNADVAAGRFRLDLYHRVLAWSVELPPLRERPDDIVPLAEYFLARAMGIDRPPMLDTVVKVFLRTRAYPGNIRDLRQLMLRMATRHAGPGPITIGDVPADDRGGSPPRWPDGQFELAIRRGLDAGRGLKEIGRDAEDVAMRLALRDAEGSCRRAAERLGVSERAVQMRRAAHP